ncbi:MAG: LysE family translocator [Burkholderiaceae bacterium]
MIEIQDLPLFIASGLMLNILPGPDSVLVITRGATQGWRAGSAAAFGISAGICLHIFVGSVGLSAVLATSTIAFSVIKYAGAVYLLYLGLGLLLKPPQGLAGAGGPPRRLLYRRLFLEGFMTNALNPKVALFFLAFVPQFIGPHASNKVLSFLVLGCIFNLSGLLWCHVLAWSSSFLSRRLQAGHGTVRGLHRLIGTVFVALAVRLALSRPR